MVRDVELLQFSSMPSSRLASGAGHWFCLRQRLPPAFQLDQADRSSQLHRQTNLKGLSEGCEAVVLKAVVAKACADDVKQHCAGIEPGEGRSWRRLIKITKVKAQKA